MTTTTPSSPPDAGGETRSRVAAALLAAGAFAFCLTFFAYDCDGTLAVFDPVFYAAHAERTPAKSIIPHHPGFHLLVLAVLQATRALGLAHPGAVAVRVVAGAGGAMLLWLLVRMAGRARVAVGVACALLVATTRIFALEGASGENLLPACAAALWVFDRASQLRPRLLPLGAGLFVALLLRQDNVLLVPAVMLLLWPRFPWRSLLRFAVGTGFATLAFYGVLWLVLKPGPAFVSWMILYTGDTIREHFPLGEASFVYLATFAEAVLGWQWGVGPSRLHCALALTWMAVVACAAWLGRGATGDRRFVAAWLVALTARWFFYCWYEANDAEWHVLTIVAFAAVAARAARGDEGVPARGGAVGGSVRSAKIGLALLAGLILATLPLTWPELLRLRERRLAVNIAAAWEDAGSRGLVIALDYQAGATCDTQGIPYQFAGSGDPLAAGGEFLKRAKATREPLLLIGDRFVKGGSRFSLNGGALEPLAIMDGIQSCPEFRTFSAEGHVFALIANAASRPAPDSRR